MAKIQKMTKKLKLMCDQSGKKGQLSNLYITLSFFGAQFPKI